MNDDLVLQKEWSSTATKITAVYFNHILTDEAQLVLDNEKYVDGGWDGGYVAEFIMEHVYGELQDAMSDVNPLTNNSVAYFLELLESVYIDFQQIAEFYE
tara:strand:- start:748 stop:1047 length:300 start_codon:yes stop_codon:yes gene_type:complete